MDGKYSKMHGTPVSKEEVLAELGDPAEWSRQSRKLERDKRLKRGSAELDISGLRGYGRITGYVAYLEKELTAPLGTGTGLVSEEENARILATARAEIEAELAACRARLVELERSPDAVGTHVDDMTRWLDYARRVGKQDPELEPLDELKEMVRESNAAHDREVASLEDDIRRYQALRAALA